MRISPAEAELMYLNLNTNMDFKKITVYIHRLFFYLTTNHVTSSDSPKVRSHRPRLPDIPQQWSDLPRKNLMIILANFFFLIGLAARS